LDFFALPLLSSDRGVPLFSSWPLSPALFLPQSTLAFSNQAGYMPPNNAAPKDFAEFQKEMAAKKAAMKK